MLKTLGFYPIWYFSSLSDVQQKDIQNTVDKWLQLLVVIWTWTSWTRDLLYHYVSESLINHVFYSISQLWWSNFIYLVMNATILHILKSYSIYFQLIYYWVLSISSAMKNKTSFNMLFQKTLMIFLTSKQPSPLFSPILSQAEELPTI